MRILYIDGFPSGKKKGYRYIGNKDDVSELYSELFYLKDPPELVLDCRFLQPRMMTTLLKFIEEYKGPLKMMVTDPVPEPILSRFTQVEKYPAKRGKDFLEVRLEKIPMSMRERINVLFGLEMSLE